jgi:hypothetical protein
MAIEHNIAGTTHPKSAQPKQMVVIIIGISSNMCSLNISGLSHVNDGHKALICFRCLPLVWNHMGNLVVNKEMTQKANIWVAS